MAKSSTSFQAGQSGNPGGKPKGARNKVTTAFLETLADDFQRGGAKAIERTREEDPAAYVRALVSLCQKDIKLESEGPTFFDFLKMVEERAREAEGRDPVGK
jgi:hypothetical protein